MGSHRSVAFRTAGAALVLLTACVGGRHQATPRPVDDRSLTVGSFDFAESRLLAELYSQALEAGGYHVRRAFDLGPREFVGPALVRGLVDLVPEYAGTAVQYLSLGRVQAGAHPAEAHEALVRALKGVGLSALAAAPAQDSNAFVVTRATADRYGLRTLSDLARVGSQLTFGGPPECPTRPFCLAGLQRAYGIGFKEVVALDVGGPLTRQALRDGVVDMALLFTTDPAIGRDGVVELADDLHLQPAENVTPVVRTGVLDRSGPGMAGVVDGVSRQLTTESLRGLNATVLDGASVPAAASAWLRAALP